MSKLSLYIRTLSYFKLEQLYFKSYYALRDRFRKFVNYKFNFTLYRKGLALNLEESIPVRKSYDANKFTFLNQSVKFSDKIDWEYQDKGTLWVNHLNYFDYLLQEDMSKARGSALMYLLIDHLPKSKVAVRPYSISVRGINWIKFISKHGITRKTVDRYLFCQYRILLDRVANDSMGHHLMENGFSMLFGAYYFKGFELFSEAKIILTKELYEQILPDGGHFQLSPMYHQLMLLGILDSYNLMSNNEVFEDDTLKDLLEVSAERMLGWLDKMTYSNGEIPCLNDSTFNVAPSTSELHEYAKRLGISSREVELKESGYRVFGNGKMEGVIDIGNIGPDYQTMHAHSDTFNFELMYDKQPFIVDTGVSTFISNNIREKERSNFSHNTIRLGNVNQSEVHASFKVGSRAKVTIELDEKDHYIAYHDGYKKEGVIHQREFKVLDDQLLIRDVMVHGHDEIGKVYSFLHFHPSCKITTVEPSRLLVDNWEIIFEGKVDIKVLDYNYALGFNKTKRAKMLQVSFDGELDTKIVRRN
ncbi:MAG: hypothetical protein ACJAZ2_000203 [Glaciecola sp.]|jgi:hypothetical protein